MIETLFGLDRLATPAAFLLALLFGLAFGFALEQAGFGSSRRLSGVFYFRDMAVIKVMASAVMTAMLGLGWFLALGAVDPAQIFQMPTFLGAQVIGGLLFGIGFAMGGWCPGTAAVGVAAGRLDALVFVLGTLLGSILFNELFPMIQGLTTWGDLGVSQVHSLLGLTRSQLTAGASLGVVAVLWGAELIERKMVGTGRYLSGSFLPSLSAVFLVLGLGLLAIPERAATPLVASLPQAAPAVSVAGETHSAIPLGESEILDGIEAEVDHTDPEELAEALLRGDPDLTVIDVRPEAEFRAFHIRGALHVPLPELPEFLAPRRGRGRVVLYSNGMTHPAQARDALARLGHRNVTFLTDGLVGFRKVCLKPWSLRREPLPRAWKEKIARWRAFFENPPRIEPEAARRAALPPPAVAELSYRFVSPPELRDGLSRSDLRILDLRPQKVYNGGHVPGSLSLAAERLRGNLGGLPSMLLPAPLLAERFSLLGIEPGHEVILVPGAGRLRDATLVSLALERLGHERVAILEGGWPAWEAGGHPTDTHLPRVAPSHYPVPPGADAFTVDSTQVLAALEAGVPVLDVRSRAEFTGEKQDEARGGHIPGALSRPFSEDLDEVAGKDRFLPAEELRKDYQGLLPDPDQPVVLSCRTGHKATQTYFLLRHLLGYRRVFWYDASWTEWAADPSLPVELGPPR